jgi:hypothetical protein
MSKPHLHFTSLSLSPRELVGDIVETYRLAAEKLGYPTNYVDACFQPGAINILFFFWDVPWSTIAPYHPDCIVVNFEPLVPGTHAWVDNYNGVLKHCYLWEYSQSNFQRNRELQLNVADYVPLAWEDGAAEVVPIEDVLPDAEQDIDLVFLGNMTQRRVDVIDRLLGLGLRVVLNNGRTWSIEERDGYLRRAKLVLNFHNWDARAWSRSAGCPSCFVSARPWCASSIPTARSHPSCATPWPARPTTRSSTPSSRCWPMRRAARHSNVPASNCFGNARRRRWWHRRWSGSCSGAASRHRARRSPTRAASACAWNFHPLIRRQHWRRPVRRWRSARTATST